MGMMATKRMTRRRSRRRSYWGEIFGNDEELDENEKFLKEFFLKRPYLESGHENKFSLDDIQEVSDEEEELVKQEEYEVGVSEEEGEQQEAAAQEQGGADSSGQAGAGGGAEALKNLKKKEIAEKLERIHMIAGIESDAACKLGADDLEEDFDPEDYDRKMQEMFNDKYYEADDVDPEFGSGDEIADGTFRKKKGGKDVANGDCIDQKMKGKISLKDKVELEKEMEEYYKLDYEDTIGDLKTRFKYKQVLPNSFGLSTYEILASDDNDLNQYVSIKKIAPYREKNGR
ncbi:hypothetical protein GUJ93_ZPchr0010g10203 [Zizania palustris]|uniref:Kri1-like C-terminal domain-containing protein n=1 Tax=Zizania palustris TaxID=103762 RepID=A0A8J5W9D2_ZIZPA|nr:hypothetical protein GUJ93_ZPchr0010g10203 [Zizania palustris]